jgi:hypothetical protein
VATEVKDATMKVDLAELAFPKSFAETALNIVTNDFGWLPVRRPSRLTEPITRRDHRRRWNQNIDIAHNAPCSWRKTLSVVPGSFKQQAVDTGTPECVER